MSVAAGVSSSSWRNDVLGAEGYPASRRSASVKPFVLGAALRWYAIFYLGRYVTVDVRVAEHQHVVDTGPYRSG